MCPSSVQGVETSWNCFSYPRMPNLVILFTVRATTEFPLNEPATRNDYMIHWPQTWSPTINKLLVIKALIYIYRRKETLPPKSLKNANITQKTVIFIFLISKRMVDPTQERIYNIDAIFSTCFRLCLRLCPRLFSFEQFN